MAKLGDAFSDDERRKSVARQLQPGAIIYLDVTFPQGRRSKYLVVAHVDRECCTFIVNSQVHPFIEAHTTLAVCQVKIDAARHAYLSRDSYIACHQVLRLPTEKVITESAAVIRPINLADSTETLTRGPPNDDVNAKTSRQYFCQTSWTKTCEILL